MAEAKSPGQPLVSPSLDLNAKVFVYWNSHRKDFSIRQHGKVVDRRKVFWMRDVSFRVSEAGRLRVLANGEKGVHAGLQGWLVDYDTISSSAIQGTWAVDLTYNPHKYTSFVRRHDGCPVLKAKFVYLDASTGKPYLGGFQTS